VSELRDKDAEKLKQKCPMNVFDIEDGLCVVKRPQDCTMCRECIREAPGDTHVQLERVRNHYIFSIETTGALSPEDIFREAVQIFIAKILALKGEMDMLKQRSAPQAREEGAAGPPRAGEGPLQEDAMDLT